MEGRRTAIYKDAALCTEATASVVSIVAVIAGERDRRQPADGVAELAAALGVSPPEVMPALRKLESEGRIFYDPVTATFPRHPGEVRRTPGGAKRPGKRRTGNPFEPFEVAGVGDGLKVNLSGHEAGNGGYGQEESTGYRANPRPDHQAEKAVGAPSAARAWPFELRGGAPRRGLS